MKHIFIALLAISITSPVFAGWVSYSTDNKIGFYYDPDSVVRFGDKASIWILMDFQGGQGLLLKEITQGDRDKGYRSNRFQFEFDCTKKHYRVRYSEYFSEKMAGGKTVYTDRTPNKWQPLPPKSITDIPWKFSCRK